MNAACVGPSRRQMNEDDITLQEIFNLDLDCVLCVALGQILLKSDAIYCAVYHNFFLCK